jgi:CRP-like cAMP-binding protein
MKMVILMKLSIIKTISLFNNVSDSTLQQLTLASKHMMYKKNSLILSYDNSLNNFIHITEGIVKLCKVSLDGDDIIMDVLHSKQCYGESIILNSDSEQAYMAYSVTDIKVITIPIYLMRVLVANDHQLAINVLHSVIDKLSLQKNYIEHLSIQSCTQHIGCFFLRLMNYEDEKTTKLIKIPYGKHLIAKKIGCKPETFSRSLLKLYKIAGLRVSNLNVYIENPLMLSSYVCNKCSKTFPCHLNID